MIFSPSSFFLSLNCSIKNEKNLINRNLNFRPSLWEGRENHEKEKGKIEKRETREGGER